MVRHLHTSCVEATMSLLPLSVSVFPASPNNEKNGQGQIAPPVIISHAKLAGKAQLGVPVTCIEIRPIDFIEYS